MITEIILQILTKIFLLINSMIPDWNLPQQSYDILSESVGLLMSFDVVFPMSTILFIIVTAIGLEIAIMLLKLFRVIR